MLTQKSINNLAYKIVGCAIEIHKQLGPGLLESIYKDCFVEELTSVSVAVATELPVSIEYKGKKLKHSLRLDILVNEIIIVEIKSVEQMIPLYQAQYIILFEINEKTKRATDKF